MLEAEFTFHKVGQGCFYTGVFKNNNNKFVMVFDCGSDSKREYIDEEISNFSKELLQRRGIDLLIISHFDNDHISHIDKLIREIGKCEIVIMPYLTPIERLILCLSSSTRDSNYYNFLRDPHNYLSNLGVQNIIYIGNGDGGENPSFDVNPIIISPKIESDFGNIPLNIRKSISSNAIDDINKHDNINNEYPIDSYLILTDKSNFKIGDFWELIFYNNKLKDKILVDFSNDIKVEIGISLEENITLSHISSYFEKESVRQLKKIYKKYFSNLNVTSLAVLHKPLLDINSNNFKIGVDCYNKHKDRLTDICKYHVLENIKNYNFTLGTLLTGDINLKIPIRQKTDNIIEHFGNDINNVYVFQIPHHGSEKSWQFGIWKKFINSKIFVCNYGIVNRHKHPSANVIFDILKEAKGTLFQNNETLSFCYKISINNPSVEFIL